MTNKAYNFLEVKQPIGTFFISSIPASILAKVTINRPRGLYPDAVQRSISEKRVREISKYCEDPDATFPTSIIIAVTDDSGVTISTETNKMIIDTDKIIGEIIDGQHRLKGILASEKIDDFDLPVVLMFGLEDYQKAYIFSTINSKQAKVDMSLIYDLFALSKNRSPFKTCHEIVRALNRDKNSPFYNRLKMLGKKEDNQSFATISQGTFVKYLLELISSDPEQDTRDIKNNIEILDNPNYPLRKYFIYDQDEIILKIVMNIFLAVKDVFNEEWEDPSKSILSKSIGVGAILKLSKKLIIDGKLEGRLSSKYFAENFSKIKIFFDENENKINSDNYGSNEQARNKLYKDMLEAIKAI